MARGEEVTPTKFGWVCAARFLKPLSYLWPKFAFSPPYLRPDREFDALFKT